MIFRKKFMPTFPTKHIFGLFIENFTYSYDTQKTKVLYVGEHVERLNIMLEDHHSKYICKIICYSSSPYDILTEIERSILKDFGFYLN